MFVLFTNPQTDIGKVLIFSNGIGMIILLYNYCTQVELIEIYNKEITIKTKIRKIKGKCSEFKYDRRKRITRTLKKYDTIKIKHLPTGGKYRVHSFEWKEFEELWAYLNRNDQ